MATKSMLKTVTINDKKLGRTFIEVLENPSPLKVKK